MKNMKIFIIALITIVIVLILGIIFYGTKDIFNPESGNFDTGKDFVDNQIIVYFHDDVSFNRVKRFVRKIDGTIDGDGEDIINCYTITLDKTFDTVDEIEEYCDTLLNKYDILEDCVINEIHYLDPVVD